MQGKPPVENLYQPRKEKEYWLHINMYGYLRLSKSMVKRVLFLLYGRIYTYMQNGFYLTEGKFVMFAVRLYDEKNLKTIKRIVMDVEKVYLKDCPNVYFTIEENTNDYENGDGFLAVMNAVMNFNLIYEDNSAMHLIHCICNSFFMKSPADEGRFYKLLEQTYK